MSDNISTLHRSQSDIKCYAKMLIYPNGKHKIIAASKPIFCGSGWELSDKWDSDKRSKYSNQSSAASALRSKRRAAAKLRDYALCNEFTHFVTLTLSPEKIDRYDLDGVIKKMRSWLDNRVRRYGLKYILVPEKHKDGAYHFHGFINDTLELFDSGTFKLDGQKAPRRPRSERQKKEWLAACAKPVYNVLDWQLGFSAAIELYGDYDAAIGYVCKYITKEAEKLGGRWYYSGGDLKLPEEVLLQDVDFAEIASTQGAYIFDLVEAGFSMAIVEV